MKEDRQDQNHTRRLSGGQSRYPSINLPPRTLETVVTRVYSRL